MAFGNRNGTCRQACRGEKNNGGKRVLVMATPLTLKEEKFQNLITRFDAEHIVDMLPAPKLVEFAEKHIFMVRKLQITLKR